MKVVKLSLAIATTTLSVHAVANTVVDSGRTVFKTVTNPAAVSAEIGTLGYGANVAWSANETAEVVVGWAGGDLSASAEIGGNDSIINWRKVLGKEYADTKAKLKLNGDLSNPYIGVNVRPFSNALTVGTGVIFQDNKFDVSLTSNEAFNIKVNGNDYTVDLQDELKIKAQSGRDLAPYLTIGFKPNNNKRFGMFGEIGAVYTGKWDTKVDVIYDESQTPQDQREIKKAYYEDLKHDLSEKIAKDNIEWYPIVKLGATYRF